MPKRIGPWDWLTYLLFCACLAVVVLTFRNYGITWDEAWQSAYGEHIIRWYSSHFVDRGALEYLNLMYYGGLFDTFAQLATRISPFGLFETRHLVNALFGILGVIGAYKLGRYLKGPAAGFLAALFLVLTPVYYGHSFNNPKDIPLAAFSIFALYYLIRSVRRFPRPSRGLTAKLGLALGLALAVRVGGILLAGYLVAGVFLWLLGRYARRGSVSADLPPLGKSVASLALWFLGACVLAYLVMLIWWPYAQVDPIHNPIKALQMTMHFPGDIGMLFEGEQISSLDTPWYYASKWFLISMPEFLLLALAVGIPLGGAAVVRFVRTREDAEQFVEYGLLLIGVLFPVGLAAVTHTSLYDGLRHLLFILPPVAVLAAASVITLVRRSPSKLLTAGVTVAMGVSLVVTMVDCVQLHPYEALFFNRVFGGGMAEAAKSYETDYWGITLKEGAEWLVENYQAPEDGHKPRVASCGGPMSAEYFLPKDRFDFVGYPDPTAPIQPDVFLGLPRWGCDKLLSGRILHTVARQGAPLLYITQVSP